MFLLVDYHDYSQVVRGLTPLSSNSSLKSLVGRDGTLFSAISKIVGFYSIDFPCNFIFVVTTLL